VREESDIAEPKGLAGKRIGVPEYHMTAAVWVRGALQEDFGLDPEEMRWFTGGAEKPGREERVELPQKLRALVSPIGSDQTLFGLLVGGHLDAVIAPQIPELLSDKPPPIRRLFRNWIEMEKEYYRKHCVFPIMHTLVLRRSVFEADREIPRKIYRVLEDLKEEFYAKVALATNISALPWLDSYVSEISKLLGRDPWPFGIEPNVRTLNKFLEYALRQGLIHKKMELPRLFFDLEK
jgi:4,5-dihydroxyphthalate decarboxylase